jgi:hypothetical protein
MTGRLIGHLSRHPKLVFDVLGALKRHSLDCADIAREQVGNCPRTYSLEDTAKALDVLRELVPTW